jgi:hypothetical protein
MTLGEIELALDDDASKPRAPEGFVPTDPYLMGTPRPRPTARERLARARRG